MNQVLSNKTTIQKNQLVNIAIACRDRNFCQQIDLLQKRQGDSSIVKGLQVDATKGINQDQLQKRIQIYGSNKKVQIQMKGYCYLLWQALQDFLLRILVIAAVISIILQMVFDAQHRDTAWVQGFAIIIAVAVIANVTAFNNYQKQLQFRKLNEVADSRKMISVLRNKIILNLHQDQLVVGDIILLTEGMQIPADAMILQSSQLSTDESAMTGQTQPIKKSPYKRCIEKRNQLIMKGQKNSSDRFRVPSCIIMSGTRILSGEAKAIVIVVGDSSILGQISKILRQEQQTQTPLQIKLQILATDIGKFGLVSAFLVFIILMIRFTVQRVSQGRFDTKLHPIQIVRHFIISITVIVVAIPQGLPLAVTISLAYSVKKMLNDFNLVRKMQACQTMGGANMICSDKTGTLTTNKMTLTDIWNQKTYFTKQINKLQFAPKFNQLFINNSTINGSALLRPTKKGSSTEIAIIQFIQKCNLNYQQYRNKSKIIKKLPFSSSRKRMGTIIMMQGHQVLLQKGASEMVLGTCNRYHDSRKDQIVTLSKQKVKQIQNVITKMAQNALRTICMAYKPNVQSMDIQSKDQLGVFNIQKSQMILLCVLGVRDIPRPQVPQAIIQCKKAGVKVRMVTGDNKITAKAIAKQIGIANDQSLIMQGVQFIEKIGGVVCKNCKIQVCDCPTDKMTAKSSNKQMRVDVIKNMQAFKQIVQKLDVLARSRPQDKYALVTGLCQLGNVVAVTGDGTNDAPALKKADIGFAMGIAGTQVSRQAAAIILLDDNFNSIVKAILWGRNIYDSIKKFLQFQLTVNVVAVIITLVGSAVMKQQILTAIQMLWVNLIMDTFASLALATQPPGPQLLDRPPHKKNQYIISKTMFKHIFGQAIYQLIIMFIFAFAGQYFIPQYQSKLDQTYLTLMNFYSLQDQNKDPFSYGVNYWPRFRDNILSGFITPGRMYTPKGQFLYFIKYDATRIFSRHFTCVFNVFIFMTLFNFFNSRKLNDQKNIFSGITNNYLFPIVIIIIIGVQIIIICFFGNSFQLYNDYGLTIQQWFICIAFGSGSLLWSIFIKLLPIKTGVQFVNGENVPQFKQVITSIRSHKIKIEQSSNQHL